MRALIFDLDDTLLNRTKRISEDNQRALHRAEAAGYRLVIATSRPARSIQRFVTRSLLDRCITVSLNGAAVWLPGEPSARLYGSLTGSLARLLGALQTGDEALRYSLETDGHRFASSHPLGDAELWEHYAATRDMVIPMGEMDHDQVTKVAVDGFGRAIHQTIALGARFQELRFIPADDHTFVNIVAGHVDKSLTLEAIASTEAIDLSRSIAFGDDLPDVAMFRTVGHAVAMANARPEVKAQASEVIGDCDSDSIARYIDALLAV